jgi:hypothetical protein
MENGRDFTEWNQEAYSTHVLGQFVRYLAAASKYFRTSPCFDEEAHLECSLDEEPSRDVPMPAPNPEGSDENPAAVTGAPPAPIPTPDPAPANAEEFPMQLLPPNTSLPLPSSILAAPHPSTPLPACQATPPAPGSMEERMANLAVLESPLQRELEAMSPEQCEARVGELGSLNTMMLQRENNMACNRAGAKGVVDSVAAELTAEQAQPKKSVQKNEGLQRRRKRRPSARGEPRVRRRKRRAKVTRTRVTVKATQSLPRPGAEIEAVQPVRVRRAMLSGWRCAKRWRGGSGGGGGCRCGCGCTGQWRCIDASHQGERKRAGSRCKR